MTREERIEAALATVKNDGKHCPKCGAEWKQMKGADGGIWFICNRCSEMELPGQDTYSKYICDKASIALRDEVLALRAQVARQRQILCKVAMLRRKVLSIEQCESYEGGSPDLGTARTLGEIKAISAEADAALAEIESEEWK